MSIRLPLAQAERSEEFHHRNEPLGLVCRSVDKTLIASDCKYPVEGSPEGSENLVIQVPCFYAESLAGVKIIPGIRCPETGDVKQSLINDSQGV